MKRLVIRLAAPLFGAALGLATLPADACSDIILDPAKTLNNDVVSARTMDFPAMDYWVSQLSRVTRGVTWRSFNFMATPGRQWTNQYGFIGMDFRTQEGTLLNHQRIFNDGMNEQGLSAALLWLEVGQFVDREAGGRTPQASDLHYFDLVAWILGNYGTVAEVADALDANKDAIFGTSATTGWDPMIMKLPVHLVVHDRLGKSLIAEWYALPGGGQPSMHLHVGATTVDGVGVLTNDPTYEEQRANLDTYSNITNSDAMANTPGGFDSPARFVRLAKIRQFLDEVNPNDKYRKVGAVAQALHAINNVDLGHGVDADPLDPATPVLGWYQETGVTLVRDHTHGVIYFKGLHYQTLQRIELAKIDFRMVGGAGLVGPSIPADVLPAKSARYSQGVDVSAKLTAPRVIFPNRPWPARAELSVTVQVAAADQGKTGNYYLYAVDPQQRYWNWTGAKYGWKQVPRGSLLPAASGALVTRTFASVFSNLYFSQGDYKGWRVYAGYGSSPADMLLGGNVQEVYVFEDEIEYVDPSAAQAFF